ncbi:hypothetical protein HDU85_001518 [Gaertneriomyces sp. JEL0708]|nr:hypothetical protein HDU85_001518 [Gaertneriomyces sp. JEL0708]
MWRLLWSNEEHKIVVVGLDNAGKTTVLYRLLMGQTIATSPTIGSNVEQFKYRNINCMMWDIGGQDSLRQTWSMYFTNAKAVILVIDSTDKARLHLSREELHRMMEHEQLRKAVLLVFANKQDIKGAMHAASISNQLGLSTLKDRQWHIQACSAITGDGLNEGMDWLVSKISR